MVVWDMKVPQLFIYLIVTLPISALAEHSVDVEMKCYKIDGHADQRKCFERNATESLAALEKMETAYKLFLKSKYEDDPDEMPRIVNFFDDASLEFVSFRTKQCDFIAALAAGGNSTGDRHLSCEIALNEQRTKMLVDELEKLTSACITSYFDSINEKAFPVQPFNKISIDKARHLESEGGNYFIEVKCNEVDSLFITHRQYSKIYNLFSYKFKSGKVISYSFINSEGKVINGNVH
jgi:uncharacterized protein YecT (DUF1311 family)